MYKPFFTQLFEYNSFSILREDKILSKEESKIVSDYINKKQFNTLWKKLKVFIIENKPINFTKNDIDFILHTPFLTNRAGQTLYRGVLLPDKGKYSKWKKDKIIQMIPKREYVSFSLQKETAKNFAYGNNETETHTELLSKYKHFLSVVLTTKCPKYNLSIYDFIHILFQASSNQSDFPFSKEIIRVWRSYALPDMEVLVFKSLPLKVDFIKRWSK